MSKELTNLSYIKDLASRHGFAFQKSFGQNFIVNAGICPKIVDAAEIDESIGVLEIGTGIGVLTKELCKAAKKVVAVEIDKGLMPVLKETLSEFDNFKVINEDVLKTDLKKLIEEEFSGMDVVVCANLPYYITSPIIMKLLEENLPIKNITVMVQKEAATRICAKEGTRDIGAISLAVKYYSQPNICFNVSPGSFYPPPKVTSSVIRLDILENKNVSPKNEKNMFSLIRAGFNQRRKTLTNGVSAGLSIKKDVIDKALEELNLNKLIRPEQLTLKNFADLSDILFNN